ncbi:hypothetical protein H6F90_00340 [Trichocoleus sp. FACHB-591]|uniref:hypothetical protein n=1 Tax=Trichocoleus sp. FACHB-591 TaxID=2692872 RepID=UPI001681D082|nr:hypothetical protein [Trichocoleus sp. FACHB-591]MBD2093603.1 hypothetical protein [Trichocoleus sp. FACHB-591]
MNTEDNLSTGISNKVEVTEADNITCGIGFSFGVASSQWTPYSLDHIYAAFYFTELSNKIEKLYQNERLNRDEKDRSLIFDKYHRQHRACVTSAIFSSVAFLEATINELFAEVVELPNGYHAAQLNPDIKLLLANLWKVDVQNVNAKTATSYNLIDSIRTLEKFQIALSISKKQVLDPAASPYQDIKYLVSMRNTLMHYKPQKIVSQSNIPSIPVTEKINGLNFAALESANKFEQNPLFEGGNAYFPDRCLGYGCAQWASNSSFNFVQKFYLQLGVVPSPSFATLRKDARTAVNNLCNPSVD